jgi:transglutaminase-like putative cysteine protease
MLYSVSHTTSYMYTEPVSLCLNLVHLRPRAVPRQVCHQTQMTVIPDPHNFQSQLDYFGNPVTYFTIQEPHRKLSITAKHRIEVKANEPHRLHESPPWEEVRDLLRTQRASALLEAYQYVFDSPYVPRSVDLAAYAAPSFTPGRRLLEAVMNLTHRIHHDFRYDAKATTVATPLGEVLKQRHGVCQDFAHLQIGCLRSLGLSARYISGYLQTRAAPGRERLVGADASHAWISIFCPGIGWVDFDPTNNMIPADQHLTIAWGRDYDDISPVKGIILGGGTHTMTVAVEVVPIA